MGSQREDMYSQSSERTVNSSNVSGEQPIALTREELRVLKECRTNSLYYRGVPLGLLSIAATRLIVMSGRLPIVTKWSGFFYAGSFMGGVMMGVASYRKQCLEKIMALEDSRLGDQLRKKSGLQVHVRKASEFDSAKDALSGSADESPRLQQLEAEQREQRWNEVPHEPTKPRMPVHADPAEKGVSYEDLRRQHRALQMKVAQFNNEDSSSTDADRRPTQTPSDASNIDVFTSQTYSDVPSSSLVFRSSVSDYSSSQYSSDDAIPDGSVKQDIPKPKKRYAQATGPKNKYGDDME